MSLKTTAKKRASSLAYYRANASAINAERRAERAADPERARARERAHRAADPLAARARDKRYAQRHPDKIQLKRQRIRLRQYGLTPETFAALIAAQNNCCAICENPLPKGLHRHIDHCHKTGRVRGVLCQRCNVLLGFALENPRTLERAVAYLGGQL
jgi:hypothetical protein